jgi:hypothetical protein
MAIVLILDQRASRSSTDLVPDAAELLNDAVAQSLELPFVRTVGDEMQAVAAEGAAVHGVALFAATDRAWWLGVGIGEVERPLGATARDSRGSAFWAARTAIDTAKNKRRSPRGVAVVADGGEHERVALDLDAALNALAFILDSRTARQREAVQWAERGLAGTEIAVELGVTQQGVSQLLRAAGLEEQRRLQGLIDRAARDALAGQP